MSVIGKNDGCVISRNRLARKIGVKMGEPAFKLNDLQELNNLLLLSANFELYADQSIRMHSLLSGLSENVFQYSVDESFTLLTGMPGDHGERLWRMRDRMKTWLGLDLGCGTGKTATLAKLSSHISKSAVRRPGSYPSELGYVCNLGQLDPKLLRDCLAVTPVNEVWGIGRRYSDQLLEAGVITALDLSNFDPATARSRWGVVMERTIRELNGVACINIEGSASKQQIMTSRSLAQPIEDRNSLERIAALLMSNAASKLRMQGSVCGAVSVFAMTSPFKKGDRFARSMTVPLPVPTNDTRKLAEAATLGMRRLYEPGHDLVKVGVMLLDLCTREQASAQSSLDLGDEVKADARESALMVAVDQINGRYGRKTVRVGMEETLPISREDRMTPKYTTRLSDVPVAKA